MPLLEKYIIDLFNKNLADTFVDMLLNYANTYMSKLEPMSFLDFTAKIAFDQRWIGDMMMVDR